MKTMLCGAFLLLAFTTLFGCAQQQDKAPAAGALNTTCPVTGKPVDADFTADYMGSKVGFCCEKCLAKWNAMDEAGKKATFDAKIKKG